jgi:hypothetical protein
MPAKIDDFHPRWVLSEWAAPCLRVEAAGHFHVRRLVGKQGKSKTLSVLAAKLDRAAHLTLGRDHL